MNAVLVLIRILFVGLLFWDVESQKPVKDTHCFAAMWTELDGGTAITKVQQVFPIKKRVSAPYPDWSYAGFHTAATYYAYSYHVLDGRTTSYNPSDLSDCPLPKDDDDRWFKEPHGTEEKNGCVSGHIASANTPDGLEESQTATYYFHDSGEETSLHIFFDKPHDGDGGWVKANVWSFGLNNKGVGLLVKDDPGDNSYSWDDATGTMFPEWEWWPCCTDGFALGPLPRDESFYCINFEFYNKSGVEKFTVRGLSEYFEDNEASPISSFDVAAELVNGLELCFTQCFCPSNETMTGITDFFTNSAIREGVNGIIGTYTPQMTCQWEIRPATSSDPDDVIDGISIHWESFKIASGDKLEIFEENGVVWESVMIYDTGYQQPPPIYHSNASQVIVKFESNADQDIDDGFDATYYVVPHLSLLTPSSGSYQGLQSVEISGFQFSDSALFRCQMKCEQDPRILLSTTFVDNQNSLIITPSGGTPGISCDVSCTNDGVRCKSYLGLGCFKILIPSFPDSNRLQYSFVDSGCNPLTCAQCVNTPNCKWCRNISDPDSSRCYDRINEQLQCPVTNPDLSQLYACNCDRFSRCFEDLNQGSCNQLNDSCVCGQGYSHKDCSCHNCDQACVNGECNCNATCECPDDTFTGELCECRTCPILIPGEPDCSGHGTCSCNGTCICDDGWGPPDLACFCQVELGSRTCLGACPRTCGECGNALHCLWCPVTETCHFEDEVVDCTDSEGNDLLTAECSSFCVGCAVGAGIGIGLVLLIVGISVGALILLGGGGAGLVYLKTQGGHMGDTQTNPLYEEDEKQGANPFYEMKK